MTQEPGQNTWEYFLRSKNIVKKKKKKRLKMMIVAGVFFQREK